MRPCYVCVSIDTTPALKGASIEVTEQSVTCVESKMTRALVLISILVASEQFNDSKFSLLVTQWRRNWTMSDFDENGNHLLNDTFNQRTLYRVLGVRPVYCCHEHDQIQSQLFLQNFLFR